MEAVISWVSDTFAFQSLVRKLLYTLGGEPMDHNFLELFLVELRLV